MQLPQPIVFAWKRLYNMAAFPQIQPASFPCEKINFKCQKERYFICELSIQ